MTGTLRPLERGGRRGRRRLSPVQKYEAFVQVLTGEMTVVQCADHWGVDRSTIMRAREVAKRGALDALASSRPGTRAGGVDPELVMARDEAARLGEALKEMAVKVTLSQKRALGVTAGVPPRVEAGTKAALLGLVDGAVGAGWSTARACAVLELDSRRCRRWQHRRGAGRLDDHTAGGTAVHAITPAERRAIVELFERWGDIEQRRGRPARRGRDPARRPHHHERLQHIGDLVAVAGADPAVVGGHQHGRLRAHRVKQPGQFRIGAGGRSHILTAAPAVGVTGDIGMRQLHEHKVTATVGHSPDRGVDRTAIFVGVIAAVDHEPRLGCVPFDHSVERQPVDEHSGRPAGDTGRS